MITSCSKRPLQLPSMFIKIFNETSVQKDYEDEPLNNTWFLVPMVSRQKEQLGLEMYPILKRISLVKRILFNTLYTEKFLNKVYWKFLKATKRPLRYVDLPNQILVLTSPIS